MYVHPTSSAFDGERVRPVGTLSITTVLRSSVATASAATDLTQSEAVCTSTAARSRSGHCLDDICTRTLCGNVEATSSLCTREKYIWKFACGNTTSTPTRRTNVRIGGPTSRRRAEHYVLPRSKRFQWFKHFKVPSCSAVHTRVGFGLNGHRRAACPGWPGQADSAKMDLPRAAQGPLPEEMPVARDRASGARLAMPGPEPGVIRGSRRSSPHKAHDLETDTVLGQGQSGLNPGSP